MCTVVVKFVNVGIRILAFVITHFNTFVLTLFDWFWQIRMTQTGWSFSFPHSPAVAQTTLVLANLCLSLSEVVFAFLLCGVRVFINLCMCFLFLKVICTLLKINSPDFCAS
jgi:hypothetical protein